MNPYSSSGSHALSPTSYDERSEQEIMHMWFYALKPHEMGGFDKGNDERGCCHEISFHETNSNEINSCEISSH